MSRQLDLMPASARRRVAISEAVSVWSRVAVAVAIGCAAAAGFEAWRSQHSGNHLAALEAQHGPIKLLVKDIGSLRKQIASLTASEQLAIQLASTQSMVTLVGRLGQATAYAGGDLFVEAMEYERLPAAGGDSPSQALELRGLALNNLSVTRFVEHLRSAGMFREVNLRSTAARVIARQPAVSFQVECVL
ncbi:MAG: PilN domain-containing protein [Planctomycetota bacterium]